MTPLFSGPRKEFPLFPIILPELNKGLFNFLKNAIGFFNRPTI